MGGRGSSSASGGGILTVKEFHYFNQRRYSDPWIAKVDENGINFDKQIGEYTGGYRTGEPGELIIYKPENGQIVAFGQKDNRGNGGFTTYAVVQDGKLVEIDRGKALELAKKRKK